MHMAVADIAKPAGDHDRLVIAIPVGRITLMRCHLQGAEVSRHIRPAELIVEGCSPDWPFEHDLQW